MFRSHAKLVLNSRSRVGRCPWSQQKNTCGSMRGCSAISRNIGPWYWIGCEVTMARRATQRTVSARQLCRRTLVVRAAALGRAVVLVAPVIVVGVAVLGA